MCALTAPDDRRTTKSFNEAVIVRADGGPEPPSYGVGAGAVRQLHTLRRRSSPIVISQIVSSHDLDQRLRSVQRDPCGDADQVGDLAGPAERRPRDHRGE